MTTRHTATGREIDHAARVNAEYLAAQADAEQFFAGPKTTLRQEAVINALCVIVFDAHNRAGIDPKALEQARKALGL